MNIHPIRYVAQLKIQTVGPLLIASGGDSLLTDTPFVTDSNGLPMIPGTSICGCTRHALHEQGVPKSDIQNVFGDEPIEEGDDGYGSRIIFSSAQIVGPNGDVLDGVPDPGEDEEKRLAFRRRYQMAPIREHVRITSNGAADTRGRGKYDEQIVISGSRFVFEIELEGTPVDREFWNRTLDTLLSPAFRVGGGTRRGFGGIEVVECMQREFDLRNEMELKQYLSKTSRLGNDIEGLTSYKPRKPASSGRVIYELELAPRDMFFFGSGFGDAEVDASPKYEPSISWSPDGLPEFKDGYALISASSIKGAISHRVAYHYHLNQKIYMDSKKDETKILTSSCNPAVRALFGAAKGDDNEDTGIRGNVMISDLYINAEDIDTIILNHVSIDRFTGGALSGALYSEKTTATRSPIRLEILVESDAFKGKNGAIIEKAWHATLDDICTSRLPLGGGVMRGHGCFRGKWCRTYE